MKNPLTQTQLEDLISSNAGRLAEALYIKACETGGLHDPGHTPVSVCPRQAMQTFERVLLAIDIDPRDPDHLNRLPRQMSSGTCTEANEKWVDNGYLVEEAAR